ncbi:D-glycero-beta-D-manno-heptose 1-phosphate adenylyltransferase [Pedobacter immunditicola]|uniref:D-glycero-beta-D-manno-heptose 1-phosphate adenylyltransferase n=1 Tax=Pedobacter immunditicola TaxID=3133440 RepID=UPI0030A0ED76
MKAELIQLTDKFKKFKILVVGDFIVDAYFKGNCNRLAPEAPVPVIDILNKNYCLGGAANVAANLKALGAEVLFCSVTGRDEHAKKGQELLSSAEISSKWLVKDSARATLIKTRIITPVQAMLRFDEGTTEALSAETESQLISNIRKAYSLCDAVLIADYSKGVIGPQVIACLTTLKKEHPKPIAVDSKRLSEFAALEPSLVKPNYEETLRLLSLPFQHADRIEQIKDAGQMLHLHTRAAITAVTLDEAGSLLFKGTEFICHVTAPAAPNHQVSGAGDTYISAALLAMISGASLQRMADLSTAAAAIAVQKELTALCFNEELRAAQGPIEKFISGQSFLKSRCSWYKSQGKRIVFTNGCFDILHSGHVSYLNQAKAMGDILIVGLNTDESIKRLKGKSRPVNSLANRVEVLAALSCVDHIVPFGAKNDDTPINLIRTVMPDIFVKGGDYEDAQLPEAEILKKIGCEISFLPYITNQSTTSIINRMDQTTRLKISLLN